MVGLCDQSTIPCRIVCFIMNLSMDIENNLRSETSVEPSELQRNSNAFKSMFLE